jgi:peptide-methionine (S)-S-oxide reductase
MRVLFAAALLLASCQANGTPPPDGPEQGAPAAEPVPKGLAEAVFAAGCFWCVEAAFEPVKGVKDVLSGYTGGSIPNPSYHLVGTGITGHTEAVRVVYDPKKVSYADLLEVFWVNVDPFDLDGQFCDQGSQYRPAIFVATAEERAAAEASRTAKAGALGRPVEVPIVEASTFYVAEGYHQDFYKTNPAHYQRYRTGCRRDARLRAVWGAAAGPAPKH